MTIPIIDFRSKTCIDQMYDAYTTCGFAVFTHVYDEWLDDFTQWKLLMEEFFQLPTVVKKLNGYSGVTENLGYNWLEEERLTPTMPGDLKESYNWVSPDRMQEKYWPREFGKKHRSKFKLDIMDYFTIIVLISSIIAFTLI